jgi:hypothetical protein
MKRLLVGGVLAAALALAGVASAATGSTAARDAASTRAFIGGALGVDRAMLAHGPAELAAGKAYVASVGDCEGLPLQLPPKPGPKQTLVFLQFVIEVSVAYDDVTLTSVRPAIDRIARADERLRFSDPTLEWTVHGSTPALAAMLALRPPDVCADVQRLTATKFKQITPAGRQFSKDALTLIAGQSGSGTLIHRMRSYAPAAVATGLQRLKTLNHRVAQLPVTRVANKLVRELFGKPTIGKPPSASVRSVLGDVRSGQL